MITTDQFWSELKRRIRGWVLDILREEEVYNSTMWCFGVVNAVASDGKHADVYINAASSVTPSVPIAPHVGTVAVNDNVLILNRSRMRDLFIIAKTLQ